jgi:hypothetical protein
VWRSWCILAKMLLHYAAKCGVFVGQITIDPLSLGEYGEYLKD